MMPPQSHGWFSSKEYYADSAPLTDWRIVQGFDDAATCEQMRDQLTAPSTGAKPKDKAELDAFAAAMRHSECVETIDPRLKPN
jgi:hypothetical protein